MKDSQLSLADFKVKADKVETSKVLDKVQGGNDDCYCHFWCGKTPPRRLEKG